ncbi:MAG: hypothetical protein M1835_006830 [Candelina submexicana]|nr:MAG: hypothetical protein M1835_006830 [Candelina submexicana]
MKRMLGNLTKRASHDGSAVPSLDTPEANAGRAVRLFCESGGPNNSGEEVLHLPVIVEAAESSPAAAKEAATVIRKYLTKETSSRPHTQYNAIMLVRILADHPGKTFTRNLDAKFVATVKELLRWGRDMSVQQILRETLDSFAQQKPDDETLLPLKQMWEKEKKKMGKALYGDAQPAPRTLNAPAFNPQAQNQQANYFARSHKSRTLPPPHELAGRVEEAKMSSKLLVQVVQSTPPNEVLNNELIKEFAERCQSASRSIQGYINAENPAPDDDTLLTLIETNEQLSLAMSKHQRALLNARKALGIQATSPSPPNAPPQAAPPAPPPRRYQETQSEAPSLPPGPSLPVTSEVHRNPFADENQALPQSTQFALEPQNYGSSAVPPARDEDLYDSGYSSRPHNAPVQYSNGVGMSGYGAPLAVSEGRVSPIESRQPIDTRQTVGH